MEPFTLRVASKALNDETVAWELFEAMRWQRGAECPRCGERERVTFLAPKDGPRKTRSGKVSHRRVWKCNSCGRQFTALIGTIFEDSRIALGKWIMAIYLMASAKNGVSAHELHRDLGITYKSAWFMSHRLRLAMSISPAAEVWRNATIVADETHIGGKPRNRHGGTAAKAVKNKHGEDRKVPVLSLVNKEKGEVRSRVIPDVTGHTLRKAISEQVEMGNSVLWTDDAHAYRTFANEFVRHEAVNHGADQYVNENGAGTNLAEGYFSQLKRSLDGTHHHVSREHLGRYTGEFDFRYGTRRLADSERAMRIVAQAERKRLSYYRLSGRGVRPPISGRRPSPRG